MTLDLKPGLRVRGLSKTYPGGLAALQNISFDAPFGLYALLGPNGAGKSTLMRTLATLQEADAGTASLGTFDLTANRVSWQAQLGYLPQDFGVYNDINALELLEYFAALKGLSSKSARRAAVEYRLRQVNLWDARKRDVSTYSGGMRQRFGLAQALIGNPKLLIIDEPSAGLDPQERDRVMDLLSATAQFATVLLSTHFVHDVQDFCTRMAVLVGGRLLAEGEPDQLVRALAGQVWEGQVSLQQLEDIRQHHQILSHRTVRGTIRVRLYAAAPPGAGFSASPPDVADAYFWQQGRTAGRE
jgi:ABC-2 type transport system ATP-binding protein